MPLCFLKELLLCIFFFILFSYFFVFFCLSIVALFSRIEDTGGVSGYKVVLSHKMWTSSNTVNTFKHFKFKRLNQSLAARALWSGPTECTIKSRQPCELA